MSTRDAHPLDAARLTEGTSDADAATELALVRALDCEHPSAGAARFRLGDAHTCTLGRDSKAPVDGRATRVAQHVELRFADAWMSSTHARMRRQPHGTWLLEDADSRNGVMVNGRLRERVELRAGDVIELGRSFFVVQLVRPTLSNAVGPEGPFRLSPDLPDIATFSPRLQRAFEKLARFAPGTRPILILGEKGSGKELLARAAHALSRRRGRAASVACGAMPASILAAELFGSRFGAVHGPEGDQPGLFRSAEGGSLILDGVGEMPRAIQPELLRALKTREVIPVGDLWPVPVDVRIFSTSDKDLAAMAAHGEFDPELHGRLSQVQLQVVPLRHRMEDFGVLLPSLLKRVAGERAERISLAPNAARALFGHEWHKNVRELEETLRFAVESARGVRIEATDLPPHLVAPGPREEDTEKLYELQAESGDDVDIDIDVEEEGASLQSLRGRTFSPRPSSPSVKAPNPLRSS